MFRKLITIAATLIAATGLAVAGAGIASADTGNTSCTATSPSCTPADLLSRADAHLYRAKKRGRDRVVTDGA